MFHTRFLSPTDQKCAESSTYWQFFFYRPPGKFRYTHLGEIVKMLCEELDIYIYIYMTLLIIDKDFLYQFNLGLIAPLFTGCFREMSEKKHVFLNFQKLAGLPMRKKLATVTAHSELTVNSRWTKWSQPAVTWAVIELWPSIAVIILKMLWLSCDLAVTELWPCRDWAVTSPSRDWAVIIGPGPVTTVSSPWQFFFSWVWLVGEVDNHVAIYGSKVAEVFSAFQRRSCVQ